jgi:hypothetical protein
MMKIDYGLQMLPDTVLQIANAEEFPWFIQPELKAIKEKLTYIEDKDYDWEGNYRGYVNAKGQREGVGILIDHNSKSIGEWHQDERHGITMQVFDDDNCEWSQYINGEKEGYNTKKIDGRVKYYQYKNDKANGYGIDTLQNGAVYRGEIENGCFHGYGFFNYRNNDEYDGQLEWSLYHGEGVFKKASTGRVERILYE